MSIIEDVGDNLSNLPDIMERYQHELTDGEANLAMKDKTIETVAVENTNWQYYYDHRRVELKTLLKFTESKVDSTKSKLLRSYFETHQRDISDRMKEKYIANEPAYLMMYELLLEVEEMYESYVSIVEAFKVRGYAINNIVKLRVAQIQDSMV